MYQYRIDNLNNINNHINKDIHEESNSILMSFDLSDVNLGYYDFIKRNIINLLPGDELNIEEDVFVNNKRVGKLSKKGLEKLHLRQQKGYQIKNIEVDNVVYWYNKEKEVESLIMIPSIKLLK